MKFRSLVVLLPVIAAGCDDLRFLSPSSGSSAVAGEDGPGIDAGSTADGAWSIADVLVGSDAADAVSPPSGLADGLAVESPDAGSFSIIPPWGADAGVDPVALVDFPDPSALPPASGTSAELALSNDTSISDAGSPQCGEPPTCYLRTTIVTRQGHHVYAARLSRSYPEDSCVTKIIPGEGEVLVGDSNGRFGDPACGSASPEITLGFLVPEPLLFSWTSGQVWESASGFNSEWTLAGAGADSGSYEAAPGFTSKLWPLWSQFFVGGEVYGEMVVPLRNSTTHDLALGFALFDIRVRQ